MPKKINFLFPLFAFSLFLLIYHFSLDQFFFQDDYFELNISQAQSFGEYLNFFKFRNDIIAYRPISLQNYFFLSSKVFGLNPVGFKLIILITTLLNAILIIKIISKIAKNLTISLLTAFLWLTSSIHFMSLSWIAAAYNIVGTFFWLLTSIFFISYLEHKKFRFYILSTIAFLLTIGSFEFSVTWPVIFGFYYYYVRKNSIKKSLEVFSPFIVITLLYLFCRLLFIKVPRIPEYRIDLSLESAKAFFWYTLWSLNVPEELKKQVVNNLLIFNKKFFSEYYRLVLISFTGVVYILAISAISIFRNFKNNNNLDKKIVLFALIWFCVGISPVLLIPNHTFIMYLTLSSIGLYFLLSYLLISLKNRILTVTTIVIWLITSTTTLQFYKTNSWMIEAQKFARNFTFGIKSKFPSLPQASVIFYDLDDKRHRQALLEQHALRAIYKDPNLTIYYNKEDLIKDLKELDKRPVYIYTSQ